MNRIEKVFKQGPAFVGYITAGHKGLDYSLEAALALIEGGVNILEVGVPFSDPIADGLVIQNSSNQSLRNGTNIFDILELIKKIRHRTEVPIILFSYFNPILQADKKGMYRIAKECGVDGILVVDLPLEESELHIKKCKDNSIAPIFIIAPSTKTERIKLIDKFGSGFLYYACRSGTTGMRHSLPAEFAEKMKNIKKEAYLPVVAGFGISTKEDAEEVIKHADGFVVGSFFVNAIENGASPEELKKLAKKIDQRLRTID